jgi:hypothetical protein
MISAATQSTAKTVAGERYILAILNTTAQPVYPAVTFSQLDEETFSLITPENANDPVFWAPGEIKHFAFIAWGDGIKFHNTDAGIYWRLVPVLP